MLGRGPLRRTPIRLRNGPGRRLRRRSDLARRRGTRQALGCSRDVCPWGVVDTAPADVARSPRPPRGRRLPPLDRGLGRRDATWRRVDGRMVRVRDLERAVEDLQLIVTSLVATNAPVDRRGTPPSTPAPPPRGGPNV